MKQINDTLRSRWQALSAREQGLVGAAVVVLCLFAVWSLAFKPALSVLRSAPQQRQQAQATLDRLQGLAAEAAGLRAGAAVAGATQDAVRTMESGVDDATRELLVAMLGDSARLDAQGRFISVTFDGVSGEQVRQALQTLRSRLRAQLIEAELAPSQEGIRGRLRFEWLTG